MRGGGALQVGGEMEEGKAVKEEGASTEFL